MALWLAALFKNSLSGVLFMVFALVVAAGWLAQPARVRHKATRVPASGVRIKDMLLLALTEEIF